MTPAELFLVIGYHNEETEPEQPPPPITRAEVAEWEAEEPRTPSVKRMKKKGRQRHG